MNGKWDQQLKDFLRRTGDDLRKAGEELKGEAQRLLDEVADPDRQQRLRENFDEFKVWAQKTATEAASRIEGAARKVETVMEKAVAGVQSAGDQKPSRPAAKKTVGARKKPAASRAKAAPKAPKTAKAAKKAPARPAGPKKTIGKKKP